MIQVFSTMKNKPHHYNFMEMDTGSDPNSVSFNPIEFSISPDGKTWHSIYDEPDLRGVLCADTPYIAEAKQAHEYQKIGIQDGQHLLSSVYDQRDLKMTIIFNGMDRNNTELAFDALQRFLVSRTPYWICFENWPQRMYYVLVSGITNTHLTDWGFATEVTFTDQIGLSRSVGTTADWSNHILGFGNNEPNENGQYSFSSNSFTVRNLSDVRIDPERRGHPFKMTMKGNSGGKMKVTNTTTKESISREKDFKGTFVLDGVNPTLDDKGDLLNTDYGVLSLAVGDNQFKVENFSGTINFDFPMWWLS